MTISFHQVAIKETFPQAKVSYYGNDKVSIKRNNGGMKNRIRELRINAGLTQEQLGEKLGKAKSAISKLENGKVDLTLNLMVQLAKIFECHTRDLIADDLSPHDRAEVAVIEKFRCMAEPERRIIYKIMDIEPERPKK